MMSDGKFFHNSDRGITWTKTIGFDGPDSHYFYGSSIVPSTTELGKVYIGEAVTAIHRFGSVKIMEPTSFP